MSYLATWASQREVSASSVAFASLGSLLSEASWSQVVSSVVAVAALSYLAKRITARPRLSGIPVPGGNSFLWGHQHIVAQKSVGTAYQTWMGELHTQVLKIRGALLNSDILVIGDPLAATHIMQKHVYDYPHSSVVRARIARLLGKSLGWVEGESEHKRMRALVAPSLSPEALRAGTPDVYIAAENLAENLKTHVTENNGKCQTSIVDWINQATLQAIGRLGFGHDFQGGRSDDARQILGAWRAMASVAVSKAGFYAIVTLRRFPILNHLPLKALRVQGHVRNTIHKGVARELLRRDQVADQDVRAKDLLGLLASASKSGSISTEELKEHISMFIIAGSETTGQTLSYAIWELGRHQDVQDRLREEVMTFAGSPTYDDLQTKLPYLDAVTREVLRMHPAAPHMERVAIKDDVLPLRHPIAGTDGQEITTIPISAGQTVIIDIHTMNRLDSIWKDGSNFRPERWMEELPHKDLAPTGWSRLLTFSDGPRNCIGYRFAILQFKIILLTLIQRFKFEDTGVSITNKFASSMQPVVVGEEDKGPRLPVNISLL